MKSKLLRLARMLSFVLLLCAAHPAFALWRQIPITADGVYDDRRFAIKVTDREQFKEFEITIAPQPKEVSPFLTGRLSLISRNEWVASVPVSEKREKGIVTYRFRVTPEALTQSSFEIHASFFVPAKGRSPFATATLNKKKVEQIMGGTIYAFQLKSFVATPSH
jgi:hypothetical protein